MGYGLTLTDTLLEQLGSHAPDLAAGDWEVGRLVLAPEYRSDVNALRYCLHLTLEYIRKHDRVDRLFASCTPVLSRLYRRFAFNALARDVPLSGTSKSYTLISGNSQGVARALAGEAAQATQ